MIRFKKALINTSMFVLISVLLLLLVITIYLELVSSGSSREVFNIYRTLFFTEGSTKDRLETILEP